MANEWTDELGVVRILIEYKLVTIASMVVSTHDSISHNPKEFLFVSDLYVFVRNLSVPVAFTSQSVRVMWNSKLLWQIVIKS